MSVFYAVYLTVYRGTTGRPAGKTNIFLIGCKSTETHEVNYLNSFSLYICMFRTHRQAHTGKHTHTRTHACTHARTRTHTHTHTHTGTHTPHTHAHTHTHTQRRQCESGLMQVCHPFSLATFQDFPNDFHALSQQTSTQKCVFYFTGWENETT